MSTNAERMFFCVKLHLTVKSVNNLKPCVSPGAGPESIMRAELCGDSRGASSSRSHAVLLQALQRSRPVAACRQHRLRLQGQPGHLPSGWFHTDTHTPPLKRKKPFPRSLTFIASQWASKSTFSTSAWDLYSLSTS